MSGMTTHVRWQEIRCEECPQSGVDMGQSAGDWS